MIISAKSNNNLEQMRKLTILSFVCQGLISVLPEEEGPYEIELTNDESELSVTIKNNTGIKLNHVISISKELGEYFVESFRDYFINERDITISYFTEIPWPKFSEFKYGKNHMNVDTTIAKSHVIQNHMYIFIVNRYFGLTESDEIAHIKANEKACKVLKR